MTYYFFNKGDASMLPAMTRLAEELGLEPLYEDEPNDTFWAGSLKDEGFWGFLLIGYRPFHKEYPCVLQTAQGVDYTCPGVADAISRLAAICGCTEVYNGICTLEVDGPDKLIGISKIISGK